MTELVIENGEAFFLSDTDLQAFLDDRASGGTAGLEKYGAGIGVVYADVSGMTQHQALAMLVKRQAEARQEEAA